MTTTSRLPNFLIIGAAKAGTTSLYNYLEQHPEVFMSALKEPKFFALENEQLNFAGPDDNFRLSKYSVTTLDEYTRLFVDVENETAIGEASTFYLYSPKASQGIKRYIPDARLIAVLRNPVDRAYSNFQHNVRNGYEPIQYFEDAIDAECERIAKNWAPSWHYTKRGLYYSQVKKYLDDFGTSQVRVFLYEDLIERPDQLFREIFSFLGVDPSFRPDASKKHNVSGMPRRAFIHNFITKSNPIKNAIKPFVSRSMQKRIANGIRDRNLAHPKMSPETRMRLTEMFREDLGKLQELIQRDFSHWLSVPADVKDKQPVKVKQYMIRTEPEQRSDFEATRATKAMTDAVNVEMLLASRVFHPVYSGPAMRFRNYGPKLASRGVNMQVLTGMPRDGFSDIAEDGSPLRDIEYVNGIPIHRVNLPEGSRRKIHLKFQAELVSYCKKAKIRPDVIQFLTLTMWGVPSLLRLRRLGIPLIFTHTLLGTLSSNPLKKSLQKQSHRLPYQLMDCVVVSSQVMKDALINELGVTTRIEVIPNGLDTNRFKPLNSASERVALRKDLNLDTDAEIILFVGPIVARKGIRELIAAWRIVAAQRPKAQLVLVGPQYDRDRPSLSDENFQKNLQMEVANSGASDRVIFTGPVSDPEKYFQASDLFVFPSLREGMPNVVLEAFGCGIASILTPFKGLPSEFGRPDEQYMLIDRNPESLAASINQILDNDELRHGFAERARRWVEDNLDVELSVDKYANLYREYALKQVTV